jgi:hypothetical protein
VSEQLRQVATDNDTQLAQMQAELVALRRNVSTQTSERDELKRRLSDKDVQTLQMTVEFLNLTDIRSNLIRERDQLLENLSAKEIELEIRDRKVKTLELLQSGLLWDFLMAYRGLKNRFLPSGTRRRAIYDKALMALKTANKRWNRPSVVSQPLAGSSGAQISWSADICATSHQPTDLTPTALGSIVDRGPSEKPGSTSGGGEVEKSERTSSPWAFVCPRAEGIFFRSCNFCGGLEFRVFKQINISFPERIYGDRD